MPARSPVNPVLNLGYILNYTGPIGLTEAYVELEKKRSFRKPVSIISGWVPIKSARPIQLPAPGAGVPAPAPTEAEYEIDLKTVPNVKFEKKGRYKGRAALRAISGGNHDVPVDIKTTPIDPDPMSTMMKVMITLVILLILGLGIALFFALKGNKKEAAAVTPPPAAVTPPPTTNPPPTVADAPKPSKKKVVAPKAEVEEEPVVADGCPGGCDGDDSKVLPSGPTAAPMKTAKPKERKALVGGGKVYPAPTSPAAIAHTPTVNWPFNQDYSCIGNIQLDPKCTYDPTVVSAEVDTTLTPGKDEVFRYPFGWTVYPTTDLTRVKAAFNIGTELSPRWVLPEDYKGEGIVSLRVFLPKDEQPLILTFKMVRNKTRTP